MGTKLINIHIKHTIDKGHNNTHNSALAKSQQTNGKIDKNITNFGNTQWKETILCANNFAHV